MSDITIIRDRDWIFNALWHCCNANGSTSIRLALNIPITFMLFQGRVVKGLETDRYSGLVKTINIDDNETRFIRDTETTSNSLPFQGSLFRDIQCMRQHLLKFQKYYISNSNFELYKNTVDEIPICIVTYTDGNQEELVIKTLDILSRNESWRSQVLLVQGYVPYVSNSLGHYKVTKSKETPPEIINEMDVTTSILAKTIEKIYRNYNISGNIYSDSTPVLTTSEIPLDIDSIIASYGVDYTGKHYFLYSDYISLYFNKDRKIIEEYYQNEKIFRDNMAAHSISKDLLTLIRQALKRGVSIEASFKHFDNLNYGYVDIELLMDGLSKLGMGCTRPVAARIIQCIGGVGTNYINLEQFTTFANCNIDDLLINLVSNYANNNNYSDKNQIKLKRMGTNSNKSNLINPNITIKKENGKKNINDNGLLLQDVNESQLNTVHKQMTTRLNKTRDDLFHLGQGLIMTYRVVTYESLVNDINENLFSDDNLGKLDTNFDFLNELNSFTLVVIPDLFSTLESLFIYLSELIAVYPKSKIVLVGLIGLPYTTWPSGTVITCDLQARCIGRLLNFLLRKNKISKDDPIFMLAIGSGVHNVARFITEYMKHSPFLVDRIKVICTLNGKLQHDVGYKHLLNDLYQTMMTSNSNEVYELISSLHYSADFLYPSGNDGSIRASDHKENILSKFWSLRRDLYEDINPNSAIPGGHGQAYTGIIEQLRGLLLVNAQDKYDGRTLLENISYPIVVVQSTDDIFVNPNYMIMFERENLPDVRQLYDDLSEAINNSWSLCIKWLKAGHEVLHERSSYILSLISSFSKLQNIEPVSNDDKVVQLFSTRLKLLLKQIVSPPQKKKVINIPKADTIKFDSFTRVDKKQDEKDTINIDVTEVVAVNTNDVDEDALLALRIARKEEKKRKKKDERLKLQQDQREMLQKIQEQQQKEEEEFLKREMQRKIEEERKKEEEKKLAEFLADKIEAESSKNGKSRGKKESAIEVERRRQALKAQRAVELAAAKEKMRVEVERRNEFNNNVKMQYEDNRSRAAQEHYYEMLEKAEQARIAKEKAAARSKKRREEAEKKYLEDLAIYRNKKISERRNTAFDMSAKIIQVVSYIDLTTAKDVEADEIERSTTYSTWSDSEDNFVSNKSDKIDKTSTKDVDPHLYDEKDSIKTHIIVGEAVSSLDQLWDERAYLVENVMCFNALESKMVQFKKQCESLDLECKRLERAYTLIEINPSIAGMGTGRAGLNNAKMECESLKRSYKKKFAILSSLRAQQKSRSLKIYSFLDRVEAYQLTVKEKIEQFEIQFDKLHEFEQHLLDKGRDLKTEREALSAENEKKRFKKKQLEKRIETVNNELERIKNHDYKFVDTSIWIEGVLQRIQFDELKTHLNNELSDSYKELENMLVQMEEDSAKIADLTARIYVVKTDQDKVMGSINYIQHAYNMYCKTTPEQLAVKLQKQLTDSLEKEVKLEKRRMMERKALTIGATEGIEKLRLKEHEGRTNDEKSFLGMDMIMQPEAYQYLSVQEAEIMRFDIEYRWDLNKDDFERIWKLPEQINLALPFLFTSEEIKAHRLFNLFVRKVDDNFFRVKDYNSENSIKSLQDIESVLIAIKDRDSVNKLERNKDGVAFDNGDESFHFVATKENIIFDGRTRTENDAITIELEEWLELDQKLNNHIYEMPIVTKDLIDSIGGELTTRRVNSPKGSPKSNISPKSYLSPGRNSATGSPKQIVRNSLFSRKKKNDIHVENTSPKVSPTSSPTGSPLMTLSMSRKRLKKLGFSPTQSPDNVAGKKLVIKLKSKSKFPLTRGKLLEIWNNEDTSYENPVYNTIKDRMEKYYIGSEESILGYFKLTIMSTCCNKIINLFKKLDVELLESKQHVKETKFMRAAVDSSNNHKIERIWGGWDVIHPAAAGSLSQNSFFLRATFNCNRDHAASYAIRDPSELDIDDDDDDNLSKSTAKSLSAIELKNLGISALRALPGFQVNLDTLNSNNDSITEEQSKVVIGQYEIEDPNKEYHILLSMEKLAHCNPNIVKSKKALLVRPEKLIVLEVKNAKLNARQSRSHRFQVHDRDDMRLLNLTVSIVYQGDYTGKGYELGRLAASLFRLPDREDKKAKEKGKLIFPTPVGYAPYNLQSPNTPSGLGKLVIFHYPRDQPLRPGWFQLVLGSAANTRYSIEVTATSASLALTYVDELVEKAKGKQTMLPKLIKEFTLCQESVRLASRKIEVIDKLILEADTNAMTSLNELKRCNLEIAIDNEQMDLSEDERKELEKQVKRYELQYGHWSTLQTSRYQEKDDIISGLAQLEQKLIVLRSDRDTMKIDLDRDRKNLPACVAILRSFKEACSVANALNADMQAVRDGNEYVEMMANMTDEVVNFTTPAEDVRKRLKRDGFNALILEEQQWILLDRAMQPQRYEWLAEKEQREKDKEEEESVKGGKKKKKKNLAALESFRYSRHEIEHILHAPFQMLSSREMVVRKLINKYHDDPEIIKRKLNVATHGFDQHLAEKVRIKNFRTCSQEEKEWISIDKILHPEIWDFMINEVPPGQHDPDEKNTTVGGLNEQAIAEANFLSTKAKITAPRPIEENVVSTKQQSNMVHKLAGILGLSDMTDAGNLDASGLAAQMRKKARNEEKIKGLWHCTLTRDEIFKIWRTPRHKLKGDDEKLIHRLVHKYNGTYTYYVQNIEIANRRKLIAKKDGHHINWDVGGKNLTLDYDLRSRLILRELDRNIVTSSKYMDTEALQGNDQRFPTDVLKGHLERLLDFTLAEEIRARERSENYRDNSDDEDIMDEDGEEIDHDDEDDADKKIRKLKRKAALNARAGITPGDQKKGKQASTKGKSGAALAETLLQNMLGVGGCIACRSAKCKWETAVDIEICEKRLHALSLEIERVRGEKEATYIVSDTALSAQLGGNNVFVRNDLLEELILEQREIDRNVNLNAVDKELHDAYASRSESINVKALHGYPILLWTNNARVALEQRRHRLIAEVVAAEIANDILDWMLEGWYFGERVSDFSMLGYIPSVKPTGKMGPGLDQIKAQGVAASRMKKRHDAHKNRHILDEQRRGLMSEKSLVVQRQSVCRAEVTEMEIEQETTQHVLDVTEKTLRYFIFAMTLMYFRAMALITREKKSWREDGGGDAKKSGNNFTMERMRMMDEEYNMTARKKRIEAAFARARRGEFVKFERDRLMRRDAIMRRNLVLKEKHKKYDSALKIQTIYRGGIGRRNAKRWALKRAELEAMNALLNQTAIIIQRVYRGYLARVYTDQYRMEMAQFIAFLRAEEANADEEQFWKTHPWRKLKRDVKPVEKKLGGKVAGRDNDDVVDDETELSENSNENAKPYNLDDY